ncbi:hypothetical protein CFOL_v3_04987 [Cephalotus follicularis]|uniref:Uncharacterized protein n=1 Tax=Cephalotus follicularis TaxID=3775 RepID=A0A1Q3B0H4_CEPFO|nr:hypothetical protein CFOL_v3_04987 [Cephalotus follicularis]
MWSVSPDVPEALRTTLTADLDLTKTEKAVMSALKLCSVGLLAVQGYSLLMTNHHYLSDLTTQSRKAFAVIERQFLRSQDVAAWFNADQAIIQDTLWHKAGHPISISMKQALACSECVTAMIATAGAGSAASRLSAMETEMRAANSYKTLLATVKPLFEIYGGGLDYILLEDAMDTVRNYSIMVSGAGEATAPAMPNPPGTPSYVNLRTTALSYLGRVLDTSKDTVSFCYGFYCALSDQNQTLGGGAAADTLKTSYSLSKLKTQNYASFVSGQQAFGDYNAARAAMIAKGEYNAPKL